MPRPRPLATALEVLHRTPRTPLAATPTPLLPAPRLAARLETRANIWIKADAWTGFGLGGNKVRKLEYELAPDRLDGVTHLVTEGGPQSNHCRVAAAAAARLGLACTLAINRGPGEDGDGAGEDGLGEDGAGDAVRGYATRGGGGQRGSARGNVLLHRLFGARIVGVGGREARGRAMEAEAARVAADGGRALVVPAGASTPRGALGYAHAALEMCDQLDGAPARVFCAASSGGTMAGLVLGCALAGWPARLCAASADEPADRVRATVARLARAAAALLGGQDEGRLLRRVDEAVADMQATDAFVGKGYGLPTPEGEAAATAFARCAGIVLDPVYTAKAAAAMTASLAEENPGPDSHWVFVHTGGHPALFA